MRTVSTLCRRFPSLSPPWARVSEGKPPSLARRSEPRNHGITTFQKREAADGQKETLS